VVKVRLGSTVAMKYEFLLPSVTGIFRRTETLPSLYQLYSIQVYATGHSELCCFAHIIRQPNVNFVHPTIKFPLVNAYSIAYEYIFYLGKSLSDPICFTDTAGGKLQTEKLSLLNLSVRCSCTQFLSI
jgi:hypothetical protein